MNLQRALSFPCASLAAALLAASLAGCAPLIVGGAAVGSMIRVNDRRTSGAQIDDETIEFRGAARLRDAFGNRAHINITSYNRQVLLTGEVPNETVKQQAEQVISRMDAVRAVINELAVMPPTTLGQRSADVLITGKVRASFVDASDLQAIHYRVVTERATVYLMGRVSAREADRATQIARQVGGVQRVVRIFEMLSPDDRPATPAPVTTVLPAPAAPGVAAPAPEPTAPAGAVSTPVR